MTDYRISCSDAKVITFSVHHSDPTASLLRNLTRYHGLDPHEVLSQVLCNFTSANIMFDIDPGEIHNMLLAFWTGYEMAQRHKAAC